MATKKENREKGTTKRLNLCFRPRQQSLIPHMQTVIRGKKKKRKETSNKIVTVIWKSLSSHVLIGLLKVMTVCPSFSRIERRV